MEDIFGDQEERRQKIIDDLTQENQILKEELEDLRKRTQTT